MTGPPQVRGDIMTTADQSVDPTDQTVEMPSAEEDEFVQAQVFQREVDHPEEFHNAFVDGLMSNEIDAALTVPADQPLIVAEDEMIEAQVFQAQMDAGEEEYLAKHPGKG